MVLWRPRVPSVALLVVGLLMGWGLASIRPTQIQAGGGDRSGDSIVATGPVLISYDAGSKIQIPLEAIYLLDYKSGRLLGTVPSLHGTVGTSHYLGAFAERDLVADFNIDLDQGPRPHFLMTTGALGSYSAGWAPLYLYETTTSQLAIYRIVQQTIGTTASTRLELVEKRSLAKGKAPGQTGP